MSNRVGEDQPKAARWHIPKSWIDKDNLFWCSGYALICDVHPVARERFTWGPKIKDDSVENAQPIPKPEER